MAVFTLPPEMIGFYKKNIEFITEHAVDPDKRRYATRHEAVRHYIDIDHWGVYPFPEVPRDWTEALMKFTEVGVLPSAGDTLRLYRDTVREQAFINLDYSGVKLSAPYQTAYRDFFEQQIRPQYYEDEWKVDCDALGALFGLGPGSLDCRSAYAVDHFSEYGIVPYHLLQMQYRLTEAFREKDHGRILRLSAEMGHYIGDAHVPLHTTENYNGQMTNQVGIHAFWESRIPELFADEQYDFFVGRAEYIDDPSAYFWEAVLASHQLLDSVLMVERELSETFPEDKQYCYEERLGLTIRTQCREYARAYHQRLSGMVEARMRASVHAIGSSWYTAWVDAGQPALPAFGEYEPSVAERQEWEELQRQAQGGQSKGRAHENE
ncbi:MAG: hypothetical protein KDD19_08555 [Phaeodactylibacter sp.]|nr:hypothetical protein [Phaeodactylibacter sp.]MCB9053234.1 hypothetical protein [Lewinellaceae bacterium]